MLACTNQSYRQLSWCYSHPCILKSFFVSFNSLSGFRTVLFLCVAVSCNLTFSYQVFFMGKVKIFSSKCYNWQLSSFFFISPLQAEFALFRCCPGNVRSKWTNLSIPSLFLLVVRASQFLEQIAFQIPAKSF